MLPALLSESPQMLWKVMVLLVRRYSRKEVYNGLEHHVVVQVSGSMIMYSSANKEQGLISWLAL